MKICRIIVIITLLIISSIGCSYQREKEKRDYIGSNAYASSTIVNPLDHYTPDKEKPELFMPLLPKSGKIGESRLLFDNSQAIEYICSTPTKIIITTDNDSYTIDKISLQMQKSENAKYGVYTKNNTSCFGKDKDGYLNCWDTTSWKIIWKSDLIVDCIVPYKNNLLVYGTYFIAIVDTLIGKTIWIYKTDNDRIYLQGIFGDNIIFEYMDSRIVKHLYFLDTRNNKLLSFNYRIDNACFVNNELWVYSLDDMLLKANTITGEILSQFDKTKSGTSSLHNFTIFRNKIVDNNTAVSSSMFDPNKPLEITNNDGTFMEIVMNSPRIYYIKTDDSCQFETSTITNTNQIKDFLWFVDGKYVIGYKENGLYLFTVE